MATELFDGAALDYDDWYESELGQAVDQAERTLVARLFEPSGQKVLEVGCGTGQYTTWLVRQGWEVTAMDVSAPMMQKAQAKVAAIQQTVRWIQADIGMIVDQLEKYHGILSMTAFEFIANPEKILRELFKHLETGGCLLVGMIAGESPWSEFYVNLAKRKPESVFASANFYTEADIRNWQVGGRLEMGQALYFPPGVQSANEAWELENAHSGRPGFIVAKWVKE